MNVHQVEIGQELQGVLSSDFDCIWLNMDKPKKSELLRSNLVLWLDWKMRGQLLRFLESCKGLNSTTFFPSMKKLPVSFLAIHLGKNDWEGFFKSCRGLKLKNVLLYCDTPHVAKETYQYLSKYPETEFPKSVHFAIESGLNA